MLILAEQTVNMKLENTFQPLIIFLHIRKNIHFFRQLEGMYKALIFIINVLYVLTNSRLNVSKEFYSYL